MIQWYCPICGRVHTWVYEPQMIFECKCGFVGYLENLEDFRIQM